MSAPGERWRNRIRNGNGSEACWDFLYRVSQVLKRETFTNTKAAIFPARVAALLGCGNLEAQLALRLLVESERATRRTDGRFVYVPLDGER